MWPSDNAIKDTLSGITELVFDTADCLKLKENSVLAKTLNTELIVLAIHSLNAAFEQEEKLALAHQLRNYISSCHHQDQLKSEKLSLWKNFIRILPSARQVFMALPVLLMVILPCLIAWPLTVAIILISPFILLPPCLWIAQRLNYWLAETEQIKNTKTLTVLIDAADQSKQPINPLLITHNNKLFKENAPQEIPNFPNISEDSLAQKLTTICGNQNLKSYFIKHIGISSTYQQKNSLKDALQVVYHRLNGDLDSKLGPLSEKAVLIEKLVEGISACTPGFHNRVNTILESFHIPQNFSELLYLVRKHLVEKAATSLKNNDVHTVNRVTVIASTDGLGIKPNFAGDIYPGYLSDHTIRLALQSEFKNTYTLFNLPSLLADNLRSILIDLGYSGTKEKTESYTVGNPDSEVEKFTVLIKKYLNLYFQYFNWSNFFIIDEENSHIRDINWKLIEQYFFESLLKENYFGIPSFDDFYKNLSQLLDYKNSQDWNYLIFLAQLQPESLKLLFYYLRTLPSNATEKIEEIKAKLIPLFFEKNKMGRNVVQIAAQHHPDTLIALLDFIDKHLDQFDLDFHEFMQAANYHPESLRLMLNFTEKHLTHADKQTIQEFFLKKNDIGWNTFIYTTKNQPKTALAILDYIIKHQEMFNPNTFEGKSLFEENLVKIRQGLSNLMTLENLDRTQIDTLLKFISLYPELLVNPPKKLIVFLFCSLAITNDKKIIDDVLASHATVLLKYFSMDYFTIHNKNLSYVTEKLLCAYSAELSTRKNNNITYTTKFFKQHFGYSTDEKKEALQVLIGVMENSPACERMEKLKALESNNPVLNNGRLSQLFKACCYNEGVMQLPSIQFHR